VNGCFRKNSATRNSKMPFSGFHQCNIVTLRSKLATISIRQGQLSSIDMSPSETPGSSSAASTQFLRR
jgi:hypothetical protein